MSKSSAWQGAGIGLVTLLLSVLPAPARGELIFYAPFDGSLDATVCKGNGKALFGPPAKDRQARPVFAEGLKGKALQIGNGCRVTYKAAGNFDNQRGTLSFWGRRNGPKPDGRYTFLWAGWNNADRTWVQIYHWEWFAGVAMLHGKGGAGDVPPLHLPSDGDDGQWHFYAFTWDGPKARGYFDGWLDPAAQRLEFPVPQAVHFFVGGAERSTRLIDELKIYDEPLGPAEVCAAYREMAGTANAPSLVIPRRRGPIQIDGKIAEPAWAGAVETTGLIGETTGGVGPTPSRVKLLYDDEALYCAFTSAIPERARNDPAMTAGMTGILRQTRDQFDSDVDHDDCVEIDLQPQFPRGTWYRLVVNGLNTHYDYSVAPAGGIALGWNPRWQSASTLDADGWHVEIRIPLADVAAGGAKPGDRWGLNFTRIWQALQSGRESWKVASKLAPDALRPVTPVVFGDAQAVVVQLLDWGPVADNRLAFAGRIINPGKAPFRGQWELASDSDEIRHVERIEIAPGGSRALRLERAIQDGRTSRLAFAVLPAGGKQPLFRAEIPVTVREALEIRTANYPSRGIFGVSVDAGRLRSTPLAELALSITIRDAAGQPALAPTRITPLPHYQCDAEVDIGRLSPGPYQVECGVQRQGKSLVAKTVALEKSPLPAWYGNRIGITDQAPKPFTAVQRHGDRLACWGREYRFDDCLLPAQIVTQGQEMLAGPMELIVVDSSGKEFHSSDARADVAWGRQSGFRAEFRRRQTLGAQPIEVASWLECDGFLWNTLHLPPAPGGIRRLLVRVPLRKEWAEYVNPYDYSTTRTGRLKPEGFQAGGQPLWLGNPIGGLQFTTETLAPCRLQASTAPLRVIRQGRVTLLELTLIDRPTALDAPWEVSWGWIATPVRPPTPGYRGWLTGNCELSPGYQWYVPRGTDFDPRWLGYSHFIGSRARPDGQGKCMTSGGPYVFTSLCAPGVPEYAYWGDEWSPSRFGRHVEGGFGQCSVGCASWVDYCVWCYRQLYDRGRYVGLYYDGAAHLPDDNLYHGAGYRQEGRVVAVNPVLGARRVAQRMYCMLRQLEPERTMIMYHHSGCIDMAFLSWCDVYADGENFASRLSKKEQDYHRVYPVDSFLAQSMGHNFGLTVWMLDEFDRSHATGPEDWKRLGVQPVTQLYGLILLHDSGYWKNYGNKEGYRLVDEALRKYHFDEHYRMIPYWNQTIVKLPEKVYGSFYVHDGAHRVLLVLLNNNDQDRALRLPLDWRALGFSDPRRLRVDDAVFHEAVRIENGVLVTPIGRANMRLLAIEETP
jgi:hypothetical protein